MIEFEWLRPLWLLMFLPSIVLLWLIWKTWQQKQDVSGVCEPHLQNELCVQENDYKPPGFQWLVTGWALTILLLAGPSWTSGPQTMALGDHARVILVDLSQNDSVQLKDVLTQIVRRQSNPRTALVVYAEFPYVISPFTSDMSMLETLIPELSADIIPVSGSRLDRAVQMADQLLQATGVSHGDIVLVTHGLSSVDVELDRSANLGLWPLHIVSLGDNPLLRRQVDKFNGDMVVLSDTLVTPNLDFLESDSSDQTLSGIRNESALILLVLLLFVAAMGARHANILSLGLPTFLVLSLWALPENDALAGQSSEKFERALHFYQNGQFDLASDIWGQLDSSAAQYNLGNALVQMGRYQEALAVYESVIRHKPDSADARANYILLSEFLSNQDDQSQDQDDPQDKEQDPPVKEPKNSSQPQNSEQNKESNKELPDNLNSTSDSTLEKTDKAQDTAAVNETNVDSTDQQIGNNPGDSQQMEVPMEQSELGQWLQKVPQQQGNFLQRKLLRQHIRRGYPTDSMEAQ